MGPAEAWEAYKQVGAAGLFLTLYLVTVGMLIRTLVRQQTDAKETTMKVVHALDSSAQQMEKTVEALRNIEASVKMSATQTGEFIAFLKGRDSR